MPEIQDQRQFEEWLKSQTPELCSLVATRAALRVFSIVTRVGLQSHHHKMFALGVARIICYSWASTQQPFPPSVHVPDSKAHVNEVRQIGPGADAIVNNAMQSTMSALAAAGTLSMKADSVRNQSIAKSSEQALTWLRTVFAATSPNDFNHFFDTKKSALELVHSPLWPNSKLPIWLDDVLEDHPDLLNSGPEWTFWRRWYQGFLDGEPLDWAFQKEIALIPDKDWEKGPEWIAAVIEEIQKKHEQSAEEKTKEADGVEPPKLSDAEIQNIANRVLHNREALAISIGGVLEQIAEFRERVRGLNALEPEYREDLLGFLDQLSAKLEEMLEQIPDAGEEISDSKAGDLAGWLRDFRPLISKNAKKYVSPANVAEAAVPSGIILGCTGIGAFVGGPAGAGVGALAGGLITGHIKPNKALDELMKPQEPPSDDG